MCCICVKYQFEGPYDGPDLISRSVFELPQRLRVAIDAGAFVGAADSVIAARPVLNRAGYKVHFVSDSYFVNAQIA